jgi:hypothetical protein
MTAFKETQIIKCPTKISFDLHLKVMDHIKQIGVSHGCELEWNILNKKDKTFIFKVYGCSKQDQQNAFIDVIKFLCKQGIEPAIVISTKTEKSEAETKLLQMQQILKEIEVPT